MADQNRLIELTVNLQAKQATGSLQEMADAAKELKDALLNAGKGAEGFGAATAALGRAKGELKELNQIARGITFDQQIQATVRFANGMVGAFAAVKGAMSLFGDQSSEEMAKVEKTMVSLLGVMRGIDEVARAFSAKNIAGLKALGQGFTNMLKSAQTASLGMKAALISTGIGAIAVALGLIVANWEQIVKWTKEALGIEKDLTKEAQERVKYQDAILKVEEENFKILEEIGKLTGNHTKDLQEQSKILDDQLKKAQAQLVIDEEIAAKSEKHKDSLKFMQTAWVVILQSMGLANKALEVELGYLTKNGEKAKDDAETVLKDKNAQLLIEQKRIDLATQLTEEEKRLFALTRTAEEDQVKLLGIYKENEIAIYELKKKIAQSSVNEKDVEISRIEALLKTGTLTGELLKQEQDRLKMLKEDKVTLENNLTLVGKQEAEYIRIQAIEKYRLELQHEMTQASQQLTLDTKDTKTEAIGIEQHLARQSAYYLRITTLNTEYLTLQNQISKGFDDYVKEWHNLDNNLENADKKLENLSTRITPSGVRLLNGAYEDVLKTLAKIGISSEEFGKLLNKQTVSAKRNLDLELSIDSSKTAAGQHAIQSLAIEQAMTALVNTQLEKQKVQLEDKAVFLQRQEDNNRTQLSDIQKQIDLKEKEKAENQQELAFMIANGVKGKELLEARNKALEKQRSIEIEINGLSDEQIKLATGRVSIIENEVITKKEIETVDDNITSNNIKLGNVTKETTAELQQQLKGVQQLADWWAKNAKFVEAGVEVLKAGLEIYAQTAANKVKMLQSDYQNWKNIADADVKKLDDQQKAIDDKLAKNQSNTDALLAEESDADSSRLAIIEQEIEAKQKVAEQEKLNSKNIAAAKLKIAQEDAKRQNAIADAQVEQQKREKLTAVVMAIVNTALAVVKAAPNPILMALAGVAGVAAVATIASQKIPPAIHVPIPKAAEGGPLVGPSHASGGIAIEAEGGEWIAPKWMMSNPRTAPVIDSLEAFRQSKPKFAEGGAVPSGIPASPATQAISIDYDKMAEAFGKVQINTSIKEIRDANRKFVNVIYDKSSI